MALTRPVALLAIVAFSVPCSAFLPQGNLRSSSQSPAVGLQVAAQAQDGPIAMQQLAGTTAAASGALFGLAIAGTVIAGAAARFSSRRSQQRVARTQGVTVMRSSFYNDAIFNKGSNRTQNIKVLLGEEDMKKSPALPFLDYPEQLGGWVGGEKGFDPLGISYILPIYYMRECELKHGRVCMLATLGWIATDLGARFPAEMFQNVSSIQAHDKMVEAGLMQPFLATVGVCELYGGWLWKHGQAGYIKRDAGDFFLGKNFLPKDEDKAREMRLKELENGRLAMLAFGGICTQAVLLGKTFPCL